MGRDALVSDALVLRAVRGVGDRGFKALVDALGTPGAVLGAGASELRERCAVTPELARAVARAEEHRPWARAQVARARRMGVRLVPYGSPDYPALLRTLPDPPAVLYVAGSIAACAPPAVAVVGSRKATEHGCRFAFRLARDLVSRGVAVVSGMARGIDSAAHRGALEGGGPTVAVFGSGIDVLSWGKVDLARRIRRRGALLSELPFGSPPLAHHFPRRNRIISGLSLGVVVVEAAEGSGSLITAGCALDQGREVFAVPGIPGSGSTRGTHGLLRQGAKLVESVEDVLEELPPVAGVPVPPAGGPEPAPPRPGLRSLFDALGARPLHIDELAARSGLAPGEAAAGLMELALAGYAEEWPGKRYSRVPDPRGAGR